MKYTSGSQKTLCAGRTPERTTFGATSPEYNIVYWDGYNRGSESLSCTAEEKMVTPDTVVADHMLRTTEIYYTFFVLYVANVS